jgi:hypothetical protein
MNTDKAECSACGDEFELADLETRNSSNYCGSCYSNEFERECGECGHVVDIDDISERDDDELCQTCAADYDNENQSEGIPERSYSSKDLHEFQSKDSGSIITSQRLFSAEIECYYPDHEAMRAVANTLPRAVGISHDGSLNDNGVEFQTPKLQGKNGEDFLRSMSKALKDNKFTVNRQTGLHIHLDGQGLLPSSRTSSYAGALIGLWTFYVLFEDVLLSFLPPSRRANRYCTLVKNDFHINEIHKAENLEKLEKLWYRVNNRRTIMLKKADKYDSSRYSGVNLHSLFASNHLEIRYHSGTIDHTKILEWVNLHQTILDAAATGNLNAGGNISSLVKIEDKTRAFFHTLRLPQRSVNYFLKRQAEFSDTQKPTEDYDNRGRERFVVADEALDLDARMQSAVITDAAPF